MDFGFAASRCTETLFLLMNSFRSTRIYTLLPLRIMAQYVPHNHRLTGGAAFVREAGTTALVGSDP